MRHRWSGLESARNVSTGLGLFAIGLLAPVAVYGDGVYANGSAGQLFEAFDLASAEVRRGPQR